MYTLFPVNKAFAYTPTFTSKNAFGVYIFYNKTNGFRIHRNEKNTNYNIHRIEVPFFFCDWRGSTGPQGIPPGHQWRLCESSWPRSGPPPQGDNGKRKCLPENGLGVPVGRADCASACVRACLQARVHASVRVSQRACELARVRVREWACSVRTCGREGAAKRSGLRASVRACERACERACGRAAVAVRASACACGQADEHESVCVSFRTSERARGLAGTRTCEQSPVHLFSTEGDRN